MVQYLSSLWRGRRGRRGRGAQGETITANSFHQLIILTANFHRKLTDLLYDTMSVPTTLRNKHEVFIPVFLNRCVRTAYWTLHQTIYAGYSLSWIKAWFAQGPGRFE